MYFKPVNLWTVTPQYKLVDIKTKRLYNTHVTLTKEGNYYGYS